MDTMPVIEAPAEAQETKTPRKKATRSKAVTPLLETVPLEVLPAPAPRLTTVQDVWAFWQQQHQSLRTAALAGDVEGITQAQANLQAVPLLAAGVLCQRFTTLEQEFCTEVARYEAAQAVLKAEQSAQAAANRPRFDALPPPRQWSMPLPSHDPKTQMRDNLAELNQCRGRCQQQQGAAGDLLQRALASPTEVQPEIQRLAAEMREAEGRLMTATTWLDQYLQK